MCCVGSLTDLCYYDSNDDAYGLTMPALCDIQGVQVA